MNYTIELASFALATIMFLYAGLSPLLESRPVNAVFLGLAAVSTILFVVIYRKAKR